MAVFTSLLAAITNGADAFLAFTGLVVVIFVLLLITVDR
jgi:hypothetical protein